MPTTEKDSVTKSSPNGLSPSEKNRLWAYHHQQEKGDVEKCEIYPAGRGKKLIIKIVDSKQKKNKPNKRRLCLLNLASNPKNIQWVAYKPQDRQFSFYMYPEGRRLSQEEILDALASILAYRIFARKYKKSPESHLLLGKRHLSLKCTTVTLKETALIQRVNLQLKRLSKQFDKWSEAYDKND